MYMQFTSFKILECRRLTLPGKPALSTSAISGEDDFATLSTRYKAAHIKILVWWIAFKTQKVADENPDSLL